MITSTQLQRAKRIYSYEGLAALIDHVKGIVVSRNLDPYTYSRLRIAMVKQVARQVKEEENS
jgi:hypothetical protein